MSFPPGTEMFQFPGFASHGYGFTVRYRKSGGLPHSEISGSKAARGSPWLIAACHVLHRLSAPRHPPNALLSLAPPQPQAGRDGKHTHASKCRGPSPAAALTRMIIDAAAQPAVGIEPTTTSRCQRTKLWWARANSNGRPHPYQGCALTS